MKTLRNILVGLALAVCALAGLSERASAANSILYVCSTGNNTTGSSWVNAITTLAAAITASGTTGTDFYYCNNGAGDSGTSLTETFKGATATPDRVFCVDTTNSPPQTGDLATTGCTWATTAGTLSIGGNVYIYGITLSPITSNAATGLNMGGTAGDITCDHCTITLTSTNANNTSLGAGSNSALSRVTWISTAYNTGAAGDTIFLVNSPFRWLGGSTGGTTAPTNLFGTNSNARYANLLVRGVDMSSLGTGKSIVASAAALGNFQFLDNRTNSLVTLCNAPTLATSGPYDFVTTDNTAVNTSSFEQSRCMYQGTLTANGSVYNTATDGVNPMSWQVITTANANPQSPFESFVIGKWFAAGTYSSEAIVATSATAGLTNADMWATLTYLSNASYPLGATITTGNTAQLPQGSAATALTTGATWAVGGLGTNYSLAIPSFTVALAGYVYVTVYVAKPSLTVDIDPVISP